MDRSPAMVIFVLLGMLPAALVAGDGAKTSDTIRRVGIVGQSCSG